MKRVLVADDEQSIRILVKYTFEKAGFCVGEAASGAEAIDFLRAKQADLVILDLMLGDLSGLDVLRVVKNDAVLQKTPIIVLSAKGDDATIVEALGIGADDYVVKPFSPSVLLARAKTVLRRDIADGASGDGSELLQITAGEATLSVDERRHTAKILGSNGTVLLNFSATEFAILATLLGSRGIVLSREQIIAATRGDDYAITERTIDVQVLSIRRKLGAVGFPALIETVRSVGYVVR